MITKNQLTEIRNRYTNFVDGYRPAPLREDVIYLLDEIERLESAIELPCKLGDTVYVISVNMILQKTVKQFVIDDNIGLKLWYGKMAWNYAKDLGVKVFLTLESAKKALNKN